MVQTNTTTSTSTSEIRTSTNVDISELEVITTSSTVQFEDREQTMFSSMRILHNLLSLNFNDNVLIDAYHLCSLERTNKLFKSERGYTTLINDIINLLISKKVYTIFDKEILNKSISFIKLDKKRYCVSLSLLLKNKEV